MKIFGLWIADCEGCESHFFYNHNDLSERACREMVSKHLWKAIQKGYMSHRKQMVQWEWKADVKNLDEEGTMLDNCIMKSQLAGLWKALKAEGIEHIEAEQNLYVGGWDKIKKQKGKWSITKFGDKSQKTLIGDFRWWVKRMLKNEQ